MARQLNKIQFLCIATGVGLFLSSTIIPLCHELHRLFLPFVSIEIIFLFLTFFFSLSSLVLFPIKWASFSPHPFLNNNKEIWQTLFFPVLISFLFGIFLHFFSIENFSSFPSRFTPDWRIFFWQILFIPIGEELLFRGTVLRCFEFLFQDSYLTLTNPILMSTWASAISFSFWHFQNFFVYQSWQVLLQIFYTFFVGLWLGIIYQKTRRIYFPIFFHSLLNAATWIFSAV